MESEWHREVIRVGLQSTAWRAALRQLPGHGIPGVTHWLTDGHGGYFAFSIVTVDDLTTYTFMGYVTGFTGAQAICVPDKPALPV